MAVWKLRSVNTMAIEDRYEIAMDAIDICGPANRCTTTTGGHFSCLLFYFACSGKPGRIELLEFFFIIFFRHSCRRILPQIGVNRREEAIVMKARGFFSVWKCIENERSEEGAKRAAKEVRAEKRERRKVPKIKQKIETKRKIN